MCAGRRQGGSFAYLTPAFALIAQVQADTSLNFPTDHDRFIYTMRVLQARPAPLLDRLRRCTVAHLGLAYAWCAAALSFQRLRAVWPCVRQPHWQTCCFPGTTTGTQEGPDDLLPGR